MTRVLDDWFRGYRSLPRAAVLGPALILLGARVAIAQSAPAVLSVGSPIERTIAADEVHSYALDVLAGHYVRLSLRQEGIDLVTRMHDPAGARLFEADSPVGMYGVEHARWVADADGRYRVDVAALEKNGPPGRYRLTLEELRPGTADDRVRVSAQAAFAEGIRFMLQSRAPALRQAVQHYERASELWRSAGEPLEEAAALHFAGFVYRLLSDYPRATERYEHALRLRRELGDRPGEAQSLSALGAIAFRLGENHRALEYYERSLSLRRADGNRQEEAQLLASIGDIQSLLGEHQRALDSFRQALDVQRNIGDRQRVLATLANIGLVYGRTGRAREALGFFEEAIELARTLGNRREQGRLFEYRGTAYRELGERQQALASYEQALELFRTAGNRLGESQTLNARGVLEMRFGAYASALEHFAAALAVQRAIGSRREQAATLNNIAAAIVDARERGIAAAGADASIDRALTAVNESLSLRRDLQDRRGEVDSLHVLARIQRHTDDLPRALASGEAGLAILEALHALPASDRMRTSYFATAQAMYEAVIDILMLLDATQPSGGYASRALHTAERARARSLLEGLTETRGRIRQGIDPERLARERDLRDRVNAAAERQTQVLSGPPNPEAAAQANRELAGLLAALQELEDEIRAGNPRYAELTRPMPLDARTIQRSVLDPATVILEYALGDDRSYAWAITPDAIYAYALPARDRIESLARDVHRLLGARNDSRAGETPLERRRRIAAADAELQDATRRLSERLLRPMAALLGNNRIVIVADGALQYVPFAALPEPLSGEAFGDPLIVRHEVVHSPSASVIAALRADMGARPNASKQLAIVADPVFSHDDPRVRRAALKNVPPPQHTAEDSDAVRSASDVGVTRFRRLRASRDEADAIASLVAAGERLKAVDFDASRATVLAADLTQYKVVHFATHGLLNNVHPELSGLVLSMYDERGQQQNGFLRLHDIYNLDLNADLVVLSACQTALGREMRGEGLVGLARGFMYAGASRVVASLWSVEDQATSTLMRRFYQQMLADGRSPAAALRAAQIAMWRDTRWNAPYYWAAFVLQGEWR